MNFDFTIYLKFVFAPFNYLFYSELNERNFMICMSFVFVENFKLI